MTPLHRAIQHSHAYMSGNYYIVALLLEQSADVNLPDSNGLTPLHYAVRNGDYYIVLLLLMAGADVTRVNKNDQTPFHYAIQHFSAALDFFNSEGKIPQWLLERGVNIDLPDKEGNTPLHRAIQQGNSSAIQWLIANGAKVNIKNNKGQSPLHCTMLMLPSYDNLNAMWAVEVADIVKLLFRNHVDVNARDEKGRTPLHLAVSMSEFGEDPNFTVIKLLLKKGADRSLKDNEGKTAVQLAETPRLKEILLFRAKASKLSASPDRFLSSQAGDLASQPPLKRRRMLGP